MKRSVVFRPGFVRGIVLLAMVQAVPSWAGPQVAVITQVEGEVKLFSQPGKTAPGPSPRAKFENTYYTVQDAKVGNEIEKGNLLRTAPGAKARVVYPNGDQFNVGGGTAYQIDWNSDSADAARAVPRMDLKYGKIRGIVEKGGPRSRFNVRTSSATMGVRGTDFFIADEGRGGATEVATLRGEVEVTPAVAKAKPVQIKAGFSTEVPAVVTESTAKKDSSPATSKSVQPPAPVIRQTSQQELVAIQKSSEVRAQISKQVESEKVIQKVLELEKKAVQTTLNDIKKADPEMYETLKAKPIASVNELNVQTVQKLAKTAPVAPKNRKPYLSELDDLEKGAYQKYFKQLD